MGLVNDAAATVEPLWMSLARKTIGIREFTPRNPGPHGETSNPVIEDWQRRAGIRRPDDEIAWCGAWLSAMMDDAGVANGLHTSGARACSGFGQKIAQPRVGCVVTFWRESPTGRKGHTGLFDHIDTAKGEIWTLGGNQGNEVKVWHYPQARLIGYWWPPLVVLARAGLDMNGVHT